MKSVALLAIAALSAMGSAIAQDNKSVIEPLKLYVVTGGHDYHMSFYRLLDDSRFRVNLRPHPGAFDGDLRKRADVIVLYDMAPVKEIGEQGRKNLRDFLESGKGLVILHHAIFDYLDWEWYTKEVSGVAQDPNRDRSRPDYKHDVSLQIEPTAKHPLLSGIAAFHITDETYRGLIIAPTNTILLRTNDPTSDGPVAWISPYKKSRVVVIQLGHDEQAHLDPNYQKLVHNAILWAGGRLN
jgi:type 1 glutamine amidotransferase